MVEKYVIGVDFGSDSARAIVVDARSGALLGEAPAAYRRWSEGKYIDSKRHMFRQHPSDYVEALEECVKGALNKAGKGVSENVAALAVATTGSTPCPVDESGAPLALREEFASDPDAMFYLWKDHTAIGEAKELDEALSDYRGADYTRYQGTYCSEWYWAKVLRCARTNGRVSENAFTWVEHCDWMPFLLTGGAHARDMYRCSCAAGHKALWHSAWNGLPALGCFEAVDPYLAKIAKGYGGAPRPSDARIGRISPGWAEKLGLPGDVLIGGSSLDSHAGAVGAGIARGTMVFSAGTSAVGLIVEEARKLRGQQISNLCGQAENSIIPGLVGIETGQAAFGDIFAWLRDLLMWPVKRLGHECGISDGAARLMEAELIASLSEAAESSESSVVALDWFNGRRYPNTDEGVESAIAGLTLGTDAPAVFAALSKGAVFGLKAIVDGLLGAGLSINEIVAVGGIARKSRYIMQLISDVTGFDIKISKSLQACARGAAIYAATAAGFFGSIPEAQKALCEGYSDVLKPNGAKRELYADLFEKYKSLGAFMERRTAGVHEMGVSN